MTAQMHQAALEAALDRGLHIFPVHTPLSGGRCSCGKSDCVENIGKHPAIKDPFTQATRDERQIRAWWAKWPNANIGCLPGRSDLLTFDCDDAREYDQLARIGCFAEPTRATQTGRAGDYGIHLWFLRPPGVPHITNLRIGDARVLVRCDAGLVVIPPSLHRSGRRYTWLDESPPIPLPPRAEAMVRDAVTRMGTTTSGNVAALVKSRRIREGDRHGSLLSIAARLAALGCEQDETLALVWAVNCTYADKGGKPEREVEELVQWVYQQEAAKPREARRAPAGQVFTFPARAS